ncbi:MAG: geopeptide radical SAM maturase [Desulfurivibrionaceae bacterium]|nr:geopeptide radical SAM maturase [Desulfurivibrionaceae bacterium]
MYLSNYLKIFPLIDNPGRQLLFSTKSGALAVVAADELAALRRGDFSLEIVADLQELGMVVVDPEQEHQEVLAMVAALNRQATNLYLDIILGMDCNFRCIYCYEGSMKGKFGMSDDTAAQLVEFVRGLLAKGRERVMVTFYGGEPLLYVKRLKSLCRDLQEAAQEHGIAFEFSLITNGSLLKPALVSELLPLGLVSAKVTLDGPPDVHNGCRPFGSGQPSFDLLLDNLRSCAGLLKLSIGGNFTPDNHHRFAELVDILKKSGLGPDVVRHVRFGSVMKQADDVVEGGYRQGCETLTEPWLAQAQIDLRRKILEAGYASRMDDPGPCKVLRDDHLTIHYDGTLCKCPVLIGRPDYVIGDIWQGVNDVAMYHPDNWRHNKKCRTCSYLPLCFGGCRYLALVRDGHMAQVDCLQTSLDSTLEEFVRQDVRYLYEAG